MPEITVFTPTGEEIRRIEVRADVFDAEERPDLAHRVVTYQLAKRRAGTHSTKTRCEIAGSSKKLFRQKGTGRARRGNIKSPLLRGGGTVFGPKPRDYEQSLPKKIRRKALASVLSSKVRNGEVVVVDGFTLETPKTKEVANLVAQLPIDGKKVLFVTGNDETLFDNLRKSANNLEGAKTLKSIGVNVYDVLNSSVLVTTVEGLEDIQKRFPQ